MVTALFVNKEYNVERSIVINKPKAEVFEYIKYLKNQSIYSKSALMDPKMKKIHKGIDGMPGFISAWESQNENLGVGEQEIKKSLRVKGWILNCALKKHSKQQSIPI